MLSAGTANGLWDEAEVGEGEGEVMASGSDGMTKGVAVGAGYTVEEGADGVGDDADVVDEDEEIDAGGAGAGAEAAVGAGAGEYDVAIDVFTARTGLGSGIGVPDTEEDDCS